MRLTDGEDLLEYVFLFGLGSRIGAAFPLVDLVLRRSGTAEVMGCSLGILGFGFGRGIKGSLVDTSIGTSLGSDFGGGFVTDSVVLLTVAF